MNRTDRFLLAVSGGVDSMVMLNLFTRAGLTAAVAHCNFQLRPEEARQEEELVSTVCAKQNVLLYVERFDTLVYAAEHKLSTQVAARQLRYAFFKRILSEYNYNWLATAHHRSDSLETTLLNLVRGTGLDGLSGIPLITESTIRPMLFATRDQIERFASQNNVSFLHDSSNFENDYARNLLRNKVIPLLKEINPGLEDTFQSTTKRLQDSKLLVKSKVEQIRAQAMTNEGDRILLSRQVIRQSVTPVLMLWEMIKEFGFSYDQCSKILHATETGKTFSSAACMILVDRDRFIVQQNTVRNDDHCLVDEDAHMVTMNDEVLEVEECLPTQVDTGWNQSVAYLDRAKLSFPLFWRYWVAGDHFTPLGMKHQKKVSDFLIDNKVDRLAKQSVSVLESGGEIVWVVGQRISDKFKLTDQTRRVAVFRWSRTGRQQGDKTHVI